MEKCEPLVKMKSATAVFGLLEYPCYYVVLQPHILCMKIKKENERLSLQLSFKHIHKVELLDNEENKGAGLVIHINAYMARRLQEALDKNGRQFVDHRTSYSRNNIIIVDILSADYFTMERVKEVIYLCEQYHRNYVIQQPRNERTIREDVLPTVYYSKIFYDQWRTLLGLHHKDVTFNVDGSPMRYTVGRIVPYHRDVFSLQPDGTLVALSGTNNKSDDSRSVIDVIPNDHHRRKMQYTSTGVLSGENAYRGLPVRHPLSVSRGYLMQSATPQYAIYQQQQQNNGGGGGEMPASDAANTLSSASAVATTSTNVGVGDSTSFVSQSAVDIPVSPGNRQPSRRAAQKREVHVIEDEEEEPDTSGNLPLSKRSNDTVFVYPSSGSHGCSVHYADLKFLDYSYMLNDTIIDFYMKYVYHELIPSEARKKIFMFNSFFYSRLSQTSPTKPHTSASHRWKRVQPNYQFVKSWTKKVNLFDVDYVIVPINEDIHWYLAVIVNPKYGIIGVDVNGLTNDGAQTQNNTDVKQKGRGPYIVVLDSLIDGEHKHWVVRDILSEYLSLEYANKRTAMNLPGESFDKMSVRLITPSGTPQQKNYVDCGIFLLNFAEIFMKNPPKITSTCVSFRSWYPNFRIKGKREELKSIIRGLASHLRFTDFLPPNATPSLKQKDKKKPLPLPIDIVVPPIRTRRHSDTSIHHCEKDPYFTSLDLSTMSRSLDSIIQQLREMPPVVITFHEGRKRSNKKTNLVMPLAEIAS